MALFRIFSFLSLLLFTSTTNADLGINCRGSSQCSALFINVESNHLIPTFNTLLTNGSGTNFPGGPLGPNVIYHSGDLIACAQNAQWAAGSVSVFMQGNVPAEGVLGSVIIERMSDLAYHCHDMCGSVPLSGDNDPHKMGWLTVNYTYRKGCNGICALPYGHKDGNGTGTSEMGPVEIATGGGSLSVSRVRRAQLDVTPQGDDDRGAED